MSREVLAPPLLRIGTNRCYRVNLVHDDFGDQKDRVRATGSKSKQKRMEYKEDDLYGEDYNEELDNDEYPIEELPNSTFKLSMHVASAFFGGIIGHKGSTKRRIESETDTVISIPQKQFTSVENKKDNCMIIVKGKTRNGVATARHKIMLLIHSLRKRSDATHFYGIPLNFGEVFAKCKEFKEQILSAGIAGIDEELFISESTIHITFGICTLMDDVERAKAAEIIQGCGKFLSDIKRPLEVNVAGLEIMNDDPSSVKVLYARVESPDVQKFGDRCFNEFNKSGFGFDDFNRGCVKLHMTLMKTKRTNRKSFDAREILKRWGNFNFGTVSPKEFALCVLGSSKQDEFYKITGSIQI